ERAVTLRPNFELHARIGTVADREMLLFAIEHELHWGAGLLRQCCRDYAEISCPELRAKATAHEFRDNTDLALGDLENLSELIAHSRGPLRGGVNRQQLWLPIGNYAVSLERTVGLDLGLVIAFNYNISFGESLLCAALLGAARSE